MRSLVILGSTGSIGAQALSVIKAQSSRFSLFALTAHNNDTLLFEQCCYFQPRFAVLIDPQAAARLAQRAQSTGLKTEVLVGSDAIIDVVSASEVDIVLSAIVGAAALLPTMAAIESSKRVLLANKESLVMAGELMMSAVRRYGAELLPIDSEHNAIFQCLVNNCLPDQAPQLKSRYVDSIVLTASGGPFRSMTLSKLATVTPQQAVAHPNWSMGAKISVDSATMMNKGLEVIEAHWLFGLPTEVLIHPQSVVHGFVRYSDGSVMAHMALPDMRVPIAYALVWPERIDSGVAPLNLVDLSAAQFFPVDHQRYPCLALAYAALQAGGTAPAVLNAANEVAVAAFLSNQLPFGRIATVVTEVLERLPVQPASALEVVLAADGDARRCAAKIITKASAIRCGKAAL